MQFKASKNNADISSHSTKHKLMEKNVNANMFTFVSLNR